MKFDKDSVIRGAIILTLLLVASYSGFFLRMLILLFCAFAIVQKIQSDKVSKLQ